MPSLADRSDFESSIVAELAPIFQDQYARAASALASATNTAPSLSTIPYAEFQSALERAMTNQLFSVFTAAGTALIIGNALAITAGSFETRARQWSEGYARELAAQIITTSQRMTGEVWSVARGDQRKIEQGLQMVYLSPARLNVIAATEVTRATSMAEHTVIFFFRHDERPRLVAVWRTQEDAPGVPDERVCEFCAPFDRHGREVWGARYPFGPPAHANCRCFMTWVAAEEFASRGYERAA